ncbi:MAG: hypothetical protein WC682_00680 [Parcubacteria group bacterium]|jgi:hypothetical protein
MTKKKLELTTVYDFVTSGTTSRSHLNSVEWFALVKDSLNACAIILPKVAENNSDSRGFKSILNHSVKGGHSNEKRLTPKEVADTLPKSLFINDRWIFMPIKILSTSEEKGQFFERQLFILADCALLVIVDTFFRKEPHPDQRLKYDPPLINENVVGCKISAASEKFGITNTGFEETIMPYFEDPVLKLGEYIIDHFLNSAITGLRKSKEEVAKIEADMKPFLDIRTRLGIWNHL